MRSFNNFLVTINKLPEVVVAEHTPVIKGKSKQFWFYRKGQHLLAVQTKSGQWIANMSSSPSKKPSWH